MPGGIYERNYERAVKVYSPDKKRVEALSKSAFYGNKRYDSGTSDNDESALDSGQRLEASAYDVSGSNTSRVLYKVGMA